MEWVGTSKTEGQVLDERDDFLETLSVEERRLRNRGQFFTPMERIWGTMPVSISAQDFEVIRRNPEQGKVYELCYKFIDDDSLEVGAGSRSGKTNTVDNMAKIDAYGNYGCESAHLFSPAEICHKAFGFLGEACVGMRVEVLPSTSSGRQRKKRRKLGSQPGSLKRLKLLNGVRGKNNTSLKSHKYNKMYFKDQGVIYDTEDPSVLVIPLLRLDEIMGWSQEGNQAPYNILTITFGTRIRRAGDALKCALQECTTEEIEHARELLEAFVKAVAASLKENDVFENFTESELNSASNASLMRWKQLVERIKGGLQATVEVPTRSVDVPAEPVHVAKSRLSVGNSLPDPWLVMVKAAINYSASNGTKLMPACQPPADDDGPPNTNQCSDNDNDGDLDVDHAERLARSIMLGGCTVELYSADID